MPTMATSPLSPEPSAVVARFWSSLHSSAHEEATETARRVLLEQPPITEAFSFDTVDDEGETGAGQPRESPIAAVEAGTPRPVVQSWNQDKLVSLVFIRRDYICGAAIGNDVTPAAVDFKACLLPREGGEDVKCNAGTHLGPRVKRMNPPTTDYLLAIAVPASSDVPKQVFSRPVLQQADLFHLPLESEAYSKLMILKLEPHKFGSCCLNCFLVLIVSLIHVSLPRQSQLCSLHVKLLLLPNLLRLKAYKKLPGRQSSLLGKAVTDRGILFRPQTRILRVQLLVPGLNWFLQLSTVMMPLSPNKHGANSPLGLRGPPPPALQALAPSLLSIGPRPGLMRMCRRL
jgi:hypothetical protein